MWLTHALSREHSDDVVHSGRQFGGKPKNSGKQEQDGDSPDMRHSEFAPQGEGWQGLIGVCKVSRDGSAIIILNFFLRIFY